METQYKIIIALLVMALVWVAILAIFGLIFLVSYICYYKTFYSSLDRTKKNDAVIKKTSFIFELYGERLVAWRKEVEQIPYEDLFIESFDGIKLHAKYYEAKKGEPIEILFHGYRGSANRDMNAAIKRALDHGRNVLAVDHRAGGKSDGTTITFGVNESRDCLKWVDYAINNIDKNAKIVLLGVSMGAATVLMASGMDLPKNVVAVVADCGYTSAKEMRIATVRDMHLPAKLLYPFIKLGGKLYGHFDIEELTPLQLMPNSTVPTIFFHGDNDEFVPHDMSKKNFDACGAKNKKFVTIEGAGHATAYLTDTEKYTKELLDFINPLLYE